jgi:predicted P-loop ATPase
MRRRSPVKSKTAKAKTKGKAKSNAVAKTDDGEKEKSKSKWRDLRSDKTPEPTLQNTRTAIKSLNINCRYDVFHGRMTISQRDQASVDVDDRLIGEFTDDSLLMLRNLIDVTFGFDPSDRLVWDAARTMAMENQYNPVVDYLAEAEAAWDGVKRLDRLAPDYFKTEDTELNRACGRKMMIAAAARARHPGCKFDTIVVLEGDEGMAKSTAFSVLAGKDNFSDESIIGSHSREMQEHVAGVWIHESADLAGMQRREVEQVKAWASRTEDRARPAYGRALKRQKRQCIMVATTNSDSYLQSQTGNRRFWPLKVLAPIDILKLQEDRLQLWGEAAYYESQGESLFLDESLWPAATEAQEARRTRDAWEDILEAITPPTSHIIDGQERISSGSIMFGILGIEAAHQTTSHSMRVATVMKK